MKRFVAIILSLYVIVVMATMSAATIFFDRLHGFCPFKSATDSTLVIYNQSNEVLTDTIGVRIGVEDFRFEAIVSNLTNGNGEKYEYIDDSGHKETINNTSWGLVLFDASGNPFIVRMKTIDDSYNDYEPRTIGLEIESDGKVLEQKKLSNKQVSLFTNPNMIAVTRKFGKLTVSVGKDRECEISVFDCPDFDIYRVGFVVYSGCKIDVNSCLLTIQSDNRTDLETEWTVETIEQRLAQTRDELEGYWKLLDRSLDENLLRLGGNYHCAMLRRECGYDFILVSGAEKELENWHFGMLKAKFEDTDLQNVFKTVWYDSSRKTLHKDVTMQLNGNDLMTISFPYQQSMIRFIKIK